MQFTALVVDDNAINTTLMVQLLKKIPNVTPVAFTDPLTAMNWCETNTPDLLLLDYMMPTLDGLTFLERFREVSALSQIPIIMISAATDREVRLRALELTANDYLNKPLDTFEFMARVRNMLALRKIQLELAAANNALIQQHERQYHTVIETSADGFLVIDMQGDILDVNAAYSMLSGYSREALLNMRTFDLRANNTAAEVAAQLKKIAELGHLRFETEHKTQSGVIWPVEISASYLPDEGGRIYYFIHDISARRQREEKLRKLSAAVEQSPHSIMISDKSGLLEYINPAFSSNSGFSKEEILGQKIGFLRSELTPLSTYLSLWKTLQQGEVWEGEFINRRKNGELYNDFSIISPLRNERGEITHYLSNQRDISEQKKAEEELARHRNNLEELVVSRTGQLVEAKTQAEEANRAKSEFLANMSHEIRTPMNAIIGFNSLCLHTELSDKQRDYLSKLGSAANSLLHIINQVLDLSKIEAAQLTLESIPVDIKQTFTQLQNLMGTLAANKQLEILFEIEPEILAANLQGDPLRLQQILLNLCSNAIKFSSRGSIQLRCCIEAATADSTTLCFSVQDNGIGISPEQIDTLFNPFTQADSSTTRRFGGTGLGLSICRGLVEKMGGRIWVESNIDAGSRFYFTAKFSRRDSKPVESKAASLTLSQLEQKMLSLRGARVLLVEDNAFNQQVLSETLKEFGLLVEISGNGQAALEALAKQSYDVVLMDLQMPVMDGYTACRLIRSNPAFDLLPVIALTANVSAEDKARCLSVGMNEHIGKPIEPEQLFAALLRLIPAVTQASTQAPAPAEQVLPAAVTAIEELDLPGINMAPVLKRMRGNLTIYLRLHELFCQQFKQAGSLLQDTLNAGDYSTARRLVHTLKGSAATIGAEQLSRVAARLEQECKLACPDYAVLMNEFASELQIVISGQTKPQEERS